MGSNLVDVSTAISSDGFVDLVAVVVDIAGAPRCSKGTSWYVTFTVKDLDVHQNARLGLKIKCFRDHPDRLVPVQQHDVIVLRGVKVCLLLSPPPPLWEGICRACGTDLFLI